jgi:hypothetical protein
LLKLLKCKMSREITLFIHFSLSKFQRFVIVWFEHVSILTRFGTI